MVSIRPRVLAAQLVSAAALIGAITATTFAAAIVVAPAPGKPAAAQARVADLESLLQLTGQGEALYRGDARKLTGYQYCSASVSLSERGEFRQAIRAASKALFLGLRDRNSDLVAHAKRDLAVAYSYSGNLADARRYAEESLKESVNFQNRPAVHGWNFKTLGDVALREGNAPRALQMYDRAIEVARDDLRFYARTAKAAALIASGDLSRAGDALSDAASSASMIRRPDAARSVLQRLDAELALKRGEFSKAADLFGQLANGEAATDYDRFWSQEGAGRALMAQNRNDDALRSFMAATRTAQKIRAVFRSEEFKTGVFGEMQRAYDSAVDLLVRAGDAAGALAVSEEGRARALLDLLRNRVVVNAEATPSAAPHLAEGEAVVAYHVLPDKTYAWIVRPGGTRVVEINVARHDLEEQVAELRRAVSRPDSAWIPQSERLYERLIAPLNIASERLLIVPHRGLHYLPFQALKKPGAGTLIETNEIAYAPSLASVLALSARGSSKGTRLLALGNPDLKDAARALPAAEREVQQIRALFSSAETYIGVSATKRLLLDRASTAEVLHIAAHAYVDPVDPLYSAIELAASAAESGVLEAHEVYGMRLPAASLVTLSACETGLGKVSNGDEMWGFTRSFLAAGAPTLVVSLWAVADESTERFMTRFYQARREGSARAAAREAQLALVKDPAYSHPFFWGAFNVIGDWR